MTRTRIAALVFTLLLASRVMANITTSLSYYSAEAEVSSVLYGTDYDFQDGVVAASAIAQVSGAYGDSTAQASGGLLNVASMVSVAILPDTSRSNSGTAASTGINAFIQLTSDTHWGFAVDVSSSTSQSAGGQVNWLSVATLTEVGGSEIYSFTSPDDGILGGGVFGPGVYDLVLGVSSYAEASVDLGGGFEFAEGSVSVSGQIYEAPVVPAPSALWLGCVGSALVVRSLRRRRALIN